MGGHGALQIFLKNPDKYKSVSAFSPICNPIECPWGQKAFSGYLGDNKEAWKVGVMSLKMLSAKWQPCCSWTHFASNFFIVIQIPWISFCSDPYCNDVIALKLCTCHDSCAVVACAKFCSDVTPPFNGVTGKLIFQRIWIRMEKLLVKWARGLNVLTQWGLNKMVAIKQTVFSNTFLLTRWGRSSDTCVCKLGHHWFR